MLNLFNTQIEGLALHRVGNKHRNEPVTLSNLPLEVDDELGGLLKEYFFRPFREKEENYYHFQHEADLEFHPVAASVSRILDDASSLVSESRKLATHLFEQSNHPHIKNGELYVCRFSDVLVDTGKVNAIGLFKSEIKQDFLEFEDREGGIAIDVRQGVNANRLDKGCLILDLERENGFKVLSVDSNRYDAKYWLEDFLGLQPLTDENFYTKNYLKFCKDFAKDVVLPAEDKQQEVMFLNRAVDHFARNDAFEETRFLNDVLDNPELVPEFKHYKVEKGPKYSIEDVAHFDIANKAVSDARKKMKNTINLDTNVQIKMDFINPESAERFVEKGWDEERQMYYYLVYFNKEIKG